VRGRARRGTAARLVGLAAVPLVAACAHPHGGGAPGPVVVRIVFPLAADSVRFTSGFGDGRDGGRSHRGQDLFCPRWTPVLAAVDGTVDWIATKRPKKGKAYELLLRGEDGNLYFYTHLNNDDPGTRDDAAPPRYAYARGLRNGDHVEAGEIIGYVGDSGNAAKWGPHLHFEIHIGKWGNAVDPAPSLHAALDRRRH
jgi:murein DD-endopeptidase MepM/ murein hydrolase activator NlpD